MVLLWILFFVVGWITGIWFAWDFMKDNPRYFIDGKKDELHRRV